ncbi:MAG: PKD domain-containing protein [Bacteroidetes bacterium]|nr:PKD domain-containing protein [Bacteroidota bacterium]
MKITANRVFRKYLSLLFLLTATTLLRAQVPVASFTSSQDSGCAPLLVNFINTSTGAVSYQWSLGNGNNSTLTNPSTSYINSGAYTVVLIATSATGIKDTIVSTITILGDPVADFNASAFSGCEDQNSILFTNISVGASSYIWDFGDGSSSNATNPSHTYTTPGTYNVKLIASNIFGCQDIAIKNSYITIHASPLAQITINQTSACDVATIFQFSASATNISSWQWNFGDGNTSTQQNPSHQYAGAGNYPVTLIVTSPNGCIDTATSANNITIGNSLVPSFTMNDSAGCGPLTIQFDCTVPNATTWSWDLGDGTTSTLDNPVHTYTNPGSYTITLTVTTQSGCNGSVTLPNLVVVDALPVANFTVLQDSGCVPFIAQFINLSTGATSYLWKFGNSDSSYLTNPTTLYTQGGYFSVTLTAISPNGCQTSITRPQLIKSFAPRAYFTGTPLVGCPGMTVQFTHTGNAVNVNNYLWNFGDGTTSNLANPSHTYAAIGNYTVYLIVTNSFGCKDTVYKANYVTVISGQVAYTVPDTFLVCQDNPIAFSDPTTGSNTWNWNFGNGSGSTSQSPSALYPTPGIYTVTLQTSMPGGCTQTFNPYAIVKAIPYDPQPIEFNFINPCKPYTISFSTQTPDITTFSWDFGDGTTSTLANPTHTYQQAGTYTIVLNMSIGEGCLATITTTITLGHSNPMLSGSQDICLGSPVQFSLTDSLAFTNALWNFGDGNTSAQLQPAYTYTTAGSYNVELITTDTLGCKDTFNLAIPVVVNNPIPAFTSNTISCVNAAVTFQNNSQNASSYSWDFGDGNTSNDLNPTHTFAQAGVYTITLTAIENTCSVTHTAVGYLNVIQAQSLFTYTTNGQCMPVTVSFTDQSNNAVQWLWYFGNGDSSVQQNPVYTYYSDPTDSIQLIITDNNGCMDTSYQVPFPYYAAGALVDDSTGCIPHAVQFSDLSNGAIAWTWNFGDNSTSTLQHPTHTYTGNGYFDVMLIAEFPGGCLDTILYPDMVHISSPVVDFYSPSLAGCSPTQISFVNTTSDATQFSWSFGDGGISSNINPQHIYYIPGTYTITLIAINSYGCSDTMIRQDYISIPGTYTNFGISTLSGCQGQGVQFTDSSINASQWSWDFGDGTIDTLCHPAHIYQDTGSYTITLITIDSIGCTSSYSYPLPLIIHPKPVAAASVTDSSGCSTFTTSFINLSQGAITYLWDLGDGDTSQLDDPTHTYIQGGMYYPELIATTSFGCKDTFQFSTGIDVWQTPVAGISASDTVGCEPAQLTFSSNSSLTQNPNYNWTTNNGLSSTDSVFQPLLVNDSIYTITLIITNSNGCSDTAQQQVLIHPSPAASATVNTNSGCNPLSTQFTNTSGGAISYTWYFGNGDSSTTTDPSYTYSIPGQYTPVLIATNNFGCSDTFTFQPGIESLLTPVAAFSVDTTAVCFGDVLQFNDQSNDTIAPTYQWDFGFTTSTLMNPVITGNSSGIFDVTLIVTNNNGCSDTSTQLQYFQVYDTLPPAVSPIASASVLNDQQVEITWFNTWQNDVAAYRLYRYNTAGNAWDLIYTDNNPVLATTALTSAYTDNGLNTKNNTYTYKVQTIDHCGYELPLDSSTSHTTINISAQSTGLIIQVSWTAYQGCTFNEYKLYRTERPSGSPQLIASLPSTTLQYTDTTLLCPFEYEYRVEAVDLCGQPFRAWSDTAAAWPENIFENQQSLIVRSTVVNNQYILTEWNAPFIHPERVLEYRIFRSIDNINFSQIATEPAAVNSYTDMTAEVQTNSYTYKVVVVNDCQIPGLESNIGKSILLEGYWKDHRTYLNWSPYEDWATGVDNYVIEFLSPQGTWVPVKTVTGTSISTELDD